MIRICRTCEIEIVVARNIVHRHYIPGTAFPCPSSGAAWSNSQRVIDEANHASTPTKKAQTIDG
jgi:hypothetical protein